MDINMSKKLNWKIGIFILLFALSSRVFARQEMRFGVQAADYSNSKILANPPLPMNYLEEKTWKLNLQPALISAEIDRKGFGESNTSKESGDFNGYGGSFSYSYSFKEKWGLFGLVSGVSLSGDAKFEQGGGNCGPSLCDVVEITNSDSNFYNFGAGVTYQFWGKEKDKFALPIFFGPNLTFAKTSQSVKGSRGGVTYADFDMEGSSAFIGLMLGVQGRITWDNFVINPFFITTQVLNDKCKTYDVTVIRTEDTTSISSGDPKLYDQSTDDCVTSDNSSGQGGRLFRYKDHSDLYSLGLNITYSPWNLTLNITAPFFDFFKDESDPKATLYTLSYSFGNFVK
jgi:hypothetical protein